MEPVKQPEQHHREDRDRGAEIKFYQALIDTDLDGQVYYDVHVGKQVDVFAWVMNRGRCAIEVKGGRHWIRDGKWYCMERDGNERALGNSPPEDAMSRALAIRDVMRKRLDGHEPWITVLLALPDTAKEDAEIAKFASDHRVHVLWGLNDLAEQLRAIVSKYGEYEPFDELDVRAELAALNREPAPPEWLARKETRQAAEDHGPTSRQLDQQMPATALETDESSAARYSFVIHNEGTVIICGAADESLAALAHALQRESEDKVAPPHVVTDHVLADPFDDGDDRLAEEPDPFGEAIVVAGFDDDAYDPFS